MGERRRFWEKLFVNDRLAQSLANNDQKAITETTEQLINEPLDHRGEVVLVGAGPGDAGLLTLKGLQQIQQADVVVYDRLVSDDIMNLVRRDADRVFVGKRAGYHCVPQEEINQILLREAQKGKRVVRLKGGDPFIFGRGGEELETLCNAGIPFSVVPGITAASGCSAYSGIPLTHRDYAQSVRLITGHLKTGGELDWENLAAEKQTLVFYMGLNQAATIQQKLIEHGMPGEMPVAIVFATWPRCNGSSDSSFSRNRRARTGEVPPEETATMSGERSIIDGIIKLAAFGASTTLQKMRRASAASLTRWLSASSSVAAIASQQVSRRLSSNGPSTRVNMPASAHAVNCGINANAFTVKRAPASNSNLALRSATSPPPTIRQSRSRNWQNIGK